MFCSFPPDFVLTFYAKIAYGRGEGSGVCAFFGISPGLGPGLGMAWLLRVWPLAFGTRHTLVGRLIRRRVSGRSGRIIHPAWFRQRHEGWKNCGTCASVFAFFSGKAPFSFSDVAAFSGVAEPFVDRARVGFARQGLVHRRCAESQWIPGPDREVFRARRVVARRGGPCAPGPVSVELGALACFTPGTGGGRFSLVPSFLHLRPEAKPW